MSLEDLKNEWRREMERSISPADLDQLFDVVQQRSSEMDVQIHGRDVREIIAAVLVVGVFAAMWPIYRSSTVAILGVGLIMLGALLIIGVLLFSRKPALSSLRELGAGILAEPPDMAGSTDPSSSQHRLVVCLSHILGCLLFGWGLTRGSMIAFGLHAVVVLAIGAGIVVLNQWAVRRHLQPVRDEVQRVIENLKKPDAK